MKAGGEVRSVNVEQLVQKVQEANLEDGLLEDSEIVDALRAQDPLNGNVEGNLYKINGLGELSYDELKSLLKNVASNDRTGGGEIPPPAANATTNEADRNRTIARLMALAHSLQEARELKKQLQQELTKVETEGQDRARIEDLKAKIKVLDVSIQSKEAIARQYLSQIAQYNTFLGKSDAYDGVDKGIMESSGIPLTPPSKDTSGKGQVTSSQTTPKAAQPGQPADGRQPPQGFGQGRAQQAGFPQAPSDAYLRAISNDQSSLDTYENILRDQRRGRELMLLFFAFARMAETGDLDWMYQFMRFITYIVSKDKGKQMAEIGKKVIELQELSRKLTDKMTEAPTEDQAEFQKIMQKIQTEGQVLSMNQRLLNQFMEEMGQAIEQLTGATQELLQTSARVKRITSRGVA